jgi:Cu/Ag efflux protein CusF
LNWGEHTIEMQPGGNEQLGVFKSAFFRRYGPPEEIGTQGGLKMKKILSVCLTSLLLGAAIPAMAQSDTNAPQAVVSAMSATAKATIEKINPTTRMITLKDSDGNTFKVKAGKEVKNFDQLKKGDEVTVNYRQQTAVALAKPGEPIPSGAAEVMLTPEKGQEPGMLKVRTMQTTETVEDIDPNTRMVTLKDSEGNTHKVKVDESVQNLEQIKKGDEIVIKSTEAIAISVSKPGQ